MGQSRGSSASRPKIKSTCVSEEGNRSSAVLYCSVFSAPLLFEVLRSLLRVHTHGLDRLLLIYFLNL